MRTFLAVLGPLLQVPEPTPDPGGAPGTDAVGTVLNLVSWIALVGCVTGVVSGGGLLGLSRMTTNGQWGSTGKNIVLASLAGGLIVGVGPQLVIWLFGLE